MIFILIENTKYGVDVNCFKSEESRQKYLDSLLIEYSNEYGQKIESVHDLIEVSFSEVWIDLFESELKG